MAKGRDHLLQPGVLPYDGYTEQERWGARRACCKARTPTPRCCSACANACAGDVLQGSTVNYRKDGSSYLVEWSISPVRDAQGQVQAYVRCSKTSPSRVRAEQRQALLARALNATQDAVLIADAAGADFVR